MQDNFSNRPEQFEKLFCMPGLKFYFSTLGGLPVKIKAVP
jgi:hypothetical protein